MIFEDHELSHAGAASSAADPKRGSITELVGRCLRSGLDFAAWRLPDSGRKIVAVQDGPASPEPARLGELANEGAFLVAPFRPDSVSQRFAIRPDFLSVEGGDGAEGDRLASFAPAFPAPSSAPRESRIVSKDEYLVQARKVIDAIRSGDFDKVVLSRVKSVPGDYRSRLGTLFDALCQSYPAAFVHIFCVAGHCWIGATPETLLRSRKDRFVTVSLAGTRPFTESSGDLATWGAKERAEQDYVTRQIQDILDEYSVSNILREGPFTRRAGNLLHLCTEFSFDRRSLDGRLAEFVEALHPTSAVCGIPKAGAMEFISGVEGRDRGYYAGFLGPVGPLAGAARGDLQLFVNLRCMRVLPDRLELHVGGGITADSKPEDEWEETEMKAETLLSVIRRIS